MRIAALVLFLLSLLSLAAMVGGMREAFQSQTTSAAVLASAISTTMLFPVAGVFCFLASVALLALDLAMRSRKRAKPAEAPEVGE